MVEWAFTLTNSEILCLQKTFEWCISIMLLSLTKFDMNVKGHIIFSHANFQGHKFKVKVAGDQTPKIWTSETDKN